jgi:hypothetical protein
MASAAAFSSLGLPDEPPAPIVPTASVFPMTTTTAMLQL